MSESLFCPNQPSVYRSNCNCPGRCAICGFKRHSAVHMPPMGGTTDDPAYDHEYQPEALGAPCPSSPADS